MVSLDHPERYNEPESGEALRKLARLNKYEIKAVLWNPHMAKHQLMVSTVGLEGGSGLSLLVHSKNCSVSRNWIYGMWTQSVTRCTSQLRLTRDQFGESGPPCGPVSL